MSIPRALTGLFIEPGGTPFPNRTLTFFRDRRGVYSQGGAVLVDEVVRTTLSAQGEIDCSLVAGVYLVMIRLEDADRYFRLEVPDRPGPHDVSTLIGSNPSPEIITAILKAADDIVAALEDYAGGVSEESLIRERQITSVSQGRPGELLDRYTTRLSGDRVGDPVPWPVVVGPRGRAVAITGQGRIALRDRIAIRDGQKYRLSARFFRQSDPTDPSGATVRVIVQWLTADYALSGSAVVYDATLSVAMGLQELDTSFGDGGDVPAPSSAVYAVPYIQTFDLDGVTLIEQLEATVAGVEGPPGPTGPRPEHEWQGFSLRFRQPDGSWGPVTNLRGAQGVPGPRPEHQWDETRLRFQLPSGGWGQWTDLRGPAPAHEWQGTSLRFRNPNNSWGPLVNLQGPQGEKGDPGNFIGLDYDGVVDTRANLPQTDGFGNPVPNGLLFFVVDEKKSFIRFIGFPPDGWAEHSSAQSTEERPYPGLLFVRSDGSNSAGGTTPGTGVRDIEEAVARAWAMGTKVAIKVLDSRPITPLEMPDTGVSLIGDSHARNITLTPAGDPEQNAILAGDGTFVTGFTFSGWRLNSLGAQHGTGPIERGFAGAFRPGAVIRRTPYFFNNSVYTVPGNSAYPPPGDPLNGNPNLSRGAGAIIADGSVISGYSLFPNIMTWGHTPASPNGIGVLTKNRGFCNPVNSIAVGQHISYMCLDGGRMETSGSASQFGDFSAWAEGFTQAVAPRRTQGPLAPYPLAAAGIEANVGAIVDAMWNGLTAEGLNAGWPAIAEELTRKDAAIFVALLAQSVRYGYEDPMIYFADGLFNFRGEPVWRPEYETAFTRSFELMAGHIATLGVGVDALAVIDGLVMALNATITIKPTEIFISQIDMAAHTWTNCGTGMSYLRVPHTRLRERSILDTIVERNRGRVNAAGQNRTQQLLVDGTLIDRDSGWSGNSWSQSTRRVATRAALAFGGGSSR